MLGQIERDRLHSGNTERERINTNDFHSSSPSRRMNDEGNSTTRSPATRARRSLKRVQMRGGAPRPHARRTLCTLSVRPWGANEADGPFSATGLVHDETAVYTQRLPRHVAGAWPREEGDHVRHVLRLLHAPERYGGRAMAGELLRGHAEERALLLGRLRPHVRLHEAWAHAVDPDALVRVREGEALGHADDGGLARVVGQIGLAPDLARHGGEA